MFGHDSLPSLIYRYGAKRPIEGAEEVDRQIRDAHRYRNKLVEIEHKRRNRVDQTLRELAPRLAELTVAVERLDGLIADCRAEIKRANAARRRRDVSLQQRAELHQLRDERKQARAELKKRKAEAFDDPEIRVALATIDREAKAASKQARAESGIYWGTYVQVEQSLSGMRTGAPPRFLKFDGNGKVAVQLQRGLSVDDALAGEDRRLRIEPVPPEAYMSGSPKALQRTRIWLRIGTEGRNPVWAVVPVTLHRPMPEDATIRWVYLTRRRVATKDHWAVSFVLARETGWQKPDVARSGAVGVNLGWRVLGEGDQRGLRVARWGGNDGAEGELRLAMRDVQRWWKVDDLRSIRDQHFNTALAALADWLAAPGCELPGWLVERTQHLRQWRSPARLAALGIQWRGERFDGDQVAFDALEQWRKRDKHLYEWEANQRRKAAAWRNDLYRNFAATLSRRYRVVCLADIDWRNLVRRPAAEDMRNDAAARKYRRIASPGILGRLLRERFAEVISVKSQHITQRCHVCSELAQSEAATQLWRRCQHCGAEWDQDVNAVRNLLRAASDPLAEKIP